MRIGDLLRTAITNSFRSKLRTTLTVIAIFVGAFTITLTSAVGTGVSSYIDSQVATLGAADTLTVTRVSPDDLTAGPIKYEPETATQNTALGAIPLVTPEDTEKIRSVPGVATVQPQSQLKPKWMEYDDHGKYVIGISGGLRPQVDLAAGQQLDNAAADPQIVLQTDDIGAMGLGTPAEAVGKPITIAINDYLGDEHRVTATLVGIQNTSLFSGESQANDALANGLRAAQEKGVPRSVVAGYPSVIVTIASGTDIESVTATLDDDGFTAMTVADRLGQFQTIIGGIIGVLNAFGIIALLAAGFGIINTLLMSVQERTREIGLMKAMGMGAGKIYALFSLEAVFIGFLGSAIGAGIAILSGSILSDVLASTVLSDVPGLTLLQFEPLPVATVILIVMVIAFLAATIPASRAAKQNPIAALRYE